ncbi:hypothetical protein SAMD00019534_023120 [Acytostelium subglobosum LB1]|uniref:hypothetical protein n=1 Tax=Acytostelium subglobosum LB1 TaxID=1410327 RepID=UPI000644E48A|nr:hypothetical protein SAMD00019534_023120 [Acytostelium subglobosum LB1]GAM19137.1 hypothetical protein SAMD00019534_023120 [Acytostelium subglobosum LB1]|eukprot:XP_012757064.1 hypothetical protein SAMD00019534_023120 [Acytostelium subglobosum LB1]
MKHYGIASLKYSVDGCRPLIQHIGRLDHQLVLQAYQSNKQLFERACYLIDAAAESRCLELVEYFHIESFATSLPFATTAALHIAAMNGDLEIVTFLHLNRSEGITLMTFDAVCKRGHLDVVAYLHEHGMDGGATPMAFIGAASNGHLDVIKYLMEHCQHVKPTSYAMEQAVRGGHYDTMRYLFETAGFKDSKLPKNIMDVAAANGHLDIVSFLDLNHKSIGATPAAVDNAASNGHLVVVKYLTQNRTEGWTAKAVENACAEGYLDIVHHLVRLRPDLGGPLCMVRAVENGHLEVVKLLMANGYLTKCKYQYYLVDLAVKHGRFELTKFLFENTTGEISQSCINWAVQFNHADILDYLIINYKTTDTVWRSALEAGCMAGYLDIVRCIKKHRPALELSALSTNIALLESRGRFSILHFLYPDNERWAPPPRD